jgi:copper chaperone
MATVKITGMSCNHCVMAVEKALKEIKGVTNVTVSLEKGQATFDEAGPVDMNTVREAIQKAGYQVG